MMNGPEKSDSVVVCAGQRVVQEGSSPSDARMRGVISERGGNASRAGGEKEGMEKPTWGTKAKAGDSQGGPAATVLARTPEGRVSTARWDPKGMRRSTGS